MGLRLHLYRTLKLIANLSTDCEAESYALGCDEAPLFKLAHSSEDPEESFLQVLVHSNACIIYSRHEKSTVGAQAIPFLIVKEDVNPSFISELNSVLDDV